MQRDNNKCSLSFLFESNKIDRPCLNQYGSGKGGQLRGADCEEESLSSCQQVLGAAVRL